MTVRQTMRALALAGTAVFGLGLLYDIALYVRNPCPTGWGPLAFFFLPGFVSVLTVPLALIGSAVAATLAISRHQWGWLASLLIASGWCLLFLDALWATAIPGVALPAVALTWTLDHALGLTCGGGSSAFSTALGMSLPLLLAPLVLLAYSSVGASSESASSSASAAESAIITRRLLWTATILALAVGVLLSALRLVSELQLANVSPFETTPGSTIRFYGYSPFNSPLGMFAAYLISPVGVVLAFALAAILAARAARRREWRWFAGLLAVELVTLAVFVVYYGSQPSFYVPLLYRWPAFALIAVALPLPLPLISLAYLWWSGDQTQAERAATLPAPNPAL